MPSRTRRIKPLDALLCSQIPSRLAPMARLPIFQIWKKITRIANVRRGRLMPMRVCVGDSPLVSEGMDACRRRAACLYGQTRFVLSPPLADVCTATGRADSGTLGCCRLPGCALLHAELQSRHSSLRSAPEKWQFGFLFLLSRHIYCSWFTGLRREYSNNCSNVNRYPGTHVQ